MKRRLFFQTSFALPVLGDTVFSPLLAASSPGKGFKINAGEGRKHGHIQLQGVNANILDVKIAGSDTNGALAVFEQTSLSPKRGVPQHVHYQQDELFYIIEGTYLFLMGDEKFELKAGDSIFMPRQVPHSWIQLSDRGKVIVTFQPAGKMEDFFVTMAAFKSPPTPEEIASVFDANEMKIVGPPVKPEYFRPKDTGRLRQRFCRDCCQRTTNRPAFTLPEA